MKGAIVYLFVAHLSFDGWYIAPPSMHPTLQACEVARAETVRGLQGDAIEEFKTECTTDPDFKLELKGAN